jgi:PEP-CTERM motif
VNNIQNAPLTISGTAADTFVINVSGTFNTNVAMTLSGVTASQILWNFTGTSGNVFSTSGGNTVDGTFLATDGGNFQFSNLNLTGALINTAGGMQIVSGSQVSTFTPFSPGASTVPEPSSMVAVLVIGGLTMGRYAWRRRCSA